MPLSLYIHIPFCESLCYYCACNKIITRHPRRADVYLRYLSREIDLHPRTAVSASMSVSCTSSCGGTPTFCPMTACVSSWACSSAVLCWCQEGSTPLRSIRARLMNSGWRCWLSWTSIGSTSGCRDFDPEVQKAVHRIQPAEKVFGLVESAQTGFRLGERGSDLWSAKADARVIDRTLEQVAQLRPDRIALYAYAHLPERFKSQRRIITRRTAHGVGQGVDAGSLH